MSAASLARKEEPHLDESNDFFVPVGLSQGEHQARAEVVRGTGGSELAHPEVGLADDLELAAGEVGQHQPRRELGADVEERQHDVLAKFGIGCCCDALR